MHFCPVDTGPVISASLHLYTLWKHFGIVAAAVCMPSLFASWACHTFQRRHEGQGQATGQVVKTATPSSPEPPLRTKEEDEHSDPPPAPTKSFCWCTEGSLEGRTGRYHVASGCHYVVRAAPPMCKVTVDFAKSRGLTPCKTCS